MPFHFLWLCIALSTSDTDRVAEYEMKLMDIDQDTLGIPDTDYDSKVYMPSSEFARICRELSSLGESVRIDVTKEGIRFASEGDIANGSVHIKPTKGHNRYANGGASSSAPKVKKEKTDDDEEMEEDDGGSIKEDDEEEEPVSSKKKKKAAVVSDDEDEEAPAEEEEEEESSSKKRKRKAADEGTKKKTKKGKKEDGEEEGEDGAVNISVTQAVSLSFSLKYLINFAKASGLCTHVELMMSTDVPLLASS